MRVEMEFLRKDYGKKEDMFYEYYKVSKTCERHLLQAA